MTKHSYSLAILSHHKCATNWLRSICRELGKQDLIAVDIVGGQESDSGSAAPSAAPVLLDVNALFAPNRRVDVTAQPTVHFVRDPRDAFVSNYWSWLRSHQNNGEAILKFREQAAHMSVEDGMMALIEPFPMGQQLKTWPEEFWNGVKTVKYEDMLADFAPTLNALFEPGGIVISDAVATKVKRATEFKKITGRNAGQEDVDHHFRKGVSGDWKNYFTPALEKAFFERHGWIGERLSYW